jgi:hypothetical protein
MPFPRPASSSHVSCVWGGNGRVGRWCVHGRGRAMRRARCVTLGKLPVTQYPNPNYSITISDSDSTYPKLVWVIRVTPPGTRFTRITRYFQSPSISSNVINI